MKTQVALITTLGEALGQDQPSEGPRIITTQMEALVRVGPNLITTTLAVAQALVPVTRSMC